MLKRILFLAVKLRYERKVGIFSLGVCNLETNEKQKFILLRIFMQNKKLTEKNVINPGKCSEFTQTF